MLFVAQQNGLGKGVTMARFLRFAVLMVCMLFAGRVFAAGGACPSGANYTNPSNPTGPMVTLSSLGVTNCYFIAANGSDANSGTSEASPWLHSPGMQQCQSNCASVSIAPGMGFIFHGGDTWHFGNSGASPYAGVFTNCAVNGSVAAGLCLDNVNGTSTNPVYYGVDKGWPSTGWTRPTITADNPLCNANTANGSACISTTDWYGQPSYYVSSCPYQVGASNNLVDVGFSKYVVLDNFELTGLCQQHTGQPSGSDTYVRYGAAQAPLYFQNLYIHGSSHLKFAALNGSTGCTSSTVCINLAAFFGSVNNGTVGETIQFNAVDFSDSDPGGQSLCFGGFYNVAYNAFRYTTQCLPNPLHSFHDNLYEYFFENGHSNMVEDIGETTGTNAIYNNVFRHIETHVASGGGVALWLAPPASTTDYVFNDVIYDVGALEYLNIGGTAGNNALGNYTFFNNTFQTNVSQPILRCHLYSIGTVTDANNQYIDDQSQYLGPCSTLVTSTALLMSNATASAKGYSSSQTFGYSPTSASSPTVGHGTSENSSFCSALANAAGSDPTLIDAATACLSDTRYACTYNAGNNTVNCPARTVVTRSASATWDIGAYKFNGGTQAQANAPNPPSNLAATVQQ